MDTQLDRAGGSLTPSGCASAHGQSRAGDDRNSIQLDEAESLCPACGARLLARILEREGKVYQRMDCPRCRPVETLIFSDSRLYRKLDAWNAKVFGPDGSESGIEHQDDAPLLAVIDITDRCNLKCPVCFAETDGSPDAYFLDEETIREMLLVIQRRSPVGCTHIQFSGGEPTIHPKFPRIIAMARQMGFDHIQVATNGLLFGDGGYVSLCESEGLQTLYLQFDGMNDEVYLKLRGRRLLDKKLRTVENVCRTNMRIVLVPTVVSSINVDQIGPIFRFAIEHSRHVTGISMQPAARIGRIPEPKEDGSPSFNLADMAIEFGKQTGLTRTPEDWFPLNAVSLITRGLSSLRGEPLLHAECDAHCSVGTYFFVDRENTATCVNQFLDMEKFFDAVGKLAPTGRGFLGGRVSRLLQTRQLSSCFDRRGAPAGLTFERLLHGLDGWEDKSVGRAPDWDQRGFNGLFVAGMHFMDPYNYNLRRLNRCIIKYVTTDGKIVPFCSYNAGERYRTVEENRRAAAVSQSPRSPS
ncbi:MAG: radical SAM protein [Acidobacteriota bacterium]